MAWLPRLPAPQARFDALTPTLQIPKDEASKSRYKREQKGHNLYNSRRWRGSDSKEGRDGLRYQTFLAAGFNCQMCGKHEANWRKLKADHIIPHRGDPARFFDRSNLQALCGHCHDSLKQKQERAGSY